MSKARGILIRAAAIRNIRDVTRTVAMVASVRFQQTHKLSSSARPYTERLADLIGDIIVRCGAGQLRHPLLTEPETAENQVLLVITSNRGLCAGYNSAVLNIAEQRRRQLAEAGCSVALHVIGKKGVEHFRFAGTPAAAEYPQIEDIPDFHEVCALADGYMSEFVSGKIDGLEVAYTQFVSAGEQRPVIGRILPLGQIEPPPAVARQAEPVPYEIVPSPAELLAELLPATVRLRLYQYLVDAAVAEQIARIAAMRAATENAGEMLDELTRKHNRLRQAQITTELAEIIGGRAGLE